VAELHRAGQTPARLSQANLVRLGKSGPQQEKSMTKITSTHSVEALSPASEIEASGAAIEPAIVADIDMNHPSVDANPRSTSTAEMNLIDLNTPSALISPDAAVAGTLMDMA
jgi:hypothetical protein